MPTSTCHLCHLHGHGSESLVRTAPLRASRSRTKKSRHTHNSTPLCNFCMDPVNRNIRAANSSSSLARLLEHTNSVPASRSNSLNRYDQEITIFPSGNEEPRTVIHNGTHSLDAHHQQHPAYEMRSSSFPRRTNAHCINHEPDIVVRRPRSRSNSRNRNLPKNGYGFDFDHSNDYYFHIQRPPPRLPKRKRTVRLRTLLLCGCYSLLVSVAVLVTLVLFYQNGWLDFLVPNQNSIRSNTTTPNYFNASTGQKIRVLPPPTNQNTTVIATSDDDRKRRKKINNPNVHVGSLIPIPKINNEIRESDGFGEQTAQSGRAINIQRNPNPRQDLNVQPVNPKSSTTISPHSRIPAVRNGRHRNSNVKTRHRLTPKLQSHTNHAKSIYTNIGTTLKPEDASYSLKVTGADDNEYTITIKDENKPDLRIIVEAPRKKATSNNKESLENLLDSNVIANPIENIASTTTTTEPLFTETTRSTVLPPFEIARTVKQNDFTFVNSELTTEKALLETEFPNSVLITEKEQENIPMLGETASGGAVRPKHGIINHNLAAVPIDEIPRVKDEINADINSITNGAQNIPSNVRNIVNSLPSDIRNSVHNLLTVVENTAQNLPYDERNNNTIVSDNPIIQSEKGVLTRTRPFVQSEISSFANELFGQEIETLEASPNQERKPVFVQFENINRLPTHHLIDLLAVKRIRDLANTKNGARALLTLLQHSQKGKSIDSAVKDKTNGSNPQSKVYSNTSSNISKSEIQLTQNHMTAKVNKTINMNNLDPIVRSALNRIILENIKKSQDRNKEESKQSSNNKLTIAATTISPTDPLITEGTPLAIENSKSSHSHTKVFVIQTPAPSPSSPKPVFTTRNPSSETHSFKMKSATRMMVTKKPIKDSSKSSAAKYTVRRKIQPKKKKQIVLNSSFRLPSSRNTRLKQNANTHKVNIVNQGNVKHAQKNPSQAKPSQLAVRPVLQNNRNLQHSLNLSQQKNSNLQPNIRLSPENVKVQTNSRTPPARRPNAHNTNRARGNVNGNPDRSSQLRQIRLILENIQKRNKAVRDRNRLSGDKASAHTSTSRTNPSLNNVPSARQRFFVQPADKNAPGQATLHNVQNLPTQRLGFPFNQTPRIGKQPDPKFSVLIKNGRNKQGRSDAARSSVFSASGREQSSRGRVPFSELVEIKPGNVRQDSSVIRAWTHRDSSGTVSRGQVRSDGSFAFTNCRPAISC